MAPLHHCPVLKAPQPTKVFFDPFNSSSTGHQRAENRLSGSTSWRDSRSYKLKHQFSDTTGTGGAKHLSDLVGAGSENFRKDGRKDNGDWEKGAPGLRDAGWQDIRGLLSGSKKRSSDDIEDGQSKKKPRLRSGSSILPPPPPPPSPPLSSKQSSESHHVSANSRTSDAEDLPQIFRGLTIYLNGTTMPLVSDHRLKQLFAQHGGNSSIALGRRTVTHVILGEKAGGGLASTKIQKENTTIRGKGIKYVTVKWVMDSIEKGKRQPESRYAANEVKNRLGGYGQASVSGVFKKKV